MITVRNGFAVEAPNGDLFVIDLDTGKVFDNENNPVFEFKSWDGTLDIDEDTVVEMIENGRILDVDFVYFD